MTGNVQKGGRNEIAMVDDIDRKYDFLGSDDDRKRKGQNVVVDSLGGKPGKIPVGNALAGQRIKNDFLEAFLKRCRIIRNWCACGGRGLR